MKTKPPNQEHRATVKFYRRHIFFSTAEADWPSHVEELDGDYGEFIRSVEAHSAGPEEALRITAFHDPTQRGHCRILTFPDQLGYRVLPGELGQWSAQYFSGERVSARFAPHLMTGHYFFVCMHNSRDIRCGECGPPLIEAFRATFESHPDRPGNQVFGCSHYGGHKFAGNVLVYPEGDWYGYVSPEMVPSLIESVIYRGEIVAPLWRGRRGLTIEEQKVFAENFANVTSLE